MRIRNVTAMAAMLALFAAACGDNGDDNGDANGDSAGGDGGGETPATLVLNWVPYGEHAPFYYGFDEGIFEEEGIRLTITPGAGSGRTAQQTGAGQTDFGWIDTPAVLNGVAEGMPIKSVGVYLQTTPASIQFFGDDHDFNEPADIAGITIGGTVGDALSQTFPAFMAANDMSEDDVSVENVDASAKVSVLVEEQVDAIMGFCHDQGPTAADLAGKEVECMNFADWGVNFYSTGLVTNDDLIESDPELVESMVRAVTRSFEAARDNPEDAVAAMVDAVENLAPPEDVIANQFESSLDLWHTDATEGERPGTNTEDDWQNTIDVFSEYSDLEDPGPVSDYYNDEFVPED